MLVGNQCCNWYGHREDNADVRVTVLRYDVGAFFRGDMIVDKEKALNALPHIVFELEAGQIPTLFWFLQNGFIVTNVAVGCSVKAFLTERLWMSLEYIRDRISTVFLDGKPVDDIDVAVIRDRSRLALSSALPGLVGATMRSGGALASLRGSITYKETGICSGGKGTVHVKLFNMVMNETGPGLLSKGILVPIPDFEAFLQGNPGFVETCRSISIDNQSADLPGLAVRKFFADCRLVRISARNAIRGENNDITA